MSLLPKTTSEFQLKDYWDGFFSKRTSAFEWYGEYADLCHVLHKYAKPTSKLLLVGCGNSRLSEDLYDAGFHAIENIDVSDVVIRQMKAKNRRKRGDMRFTKMDVLAMTFEDGAFDCVVDKATLDAIYSNTDEATVAKVEQMFAEIERVLKTTGRYIIITLAQEHILKTLLKWFESGWLLRLHKVVLDSSAGSGKGEGQRAGLGAALPVFVFILTKMARVEGRPPIKLYEYVTDNGQCVRCESAEDVGGYVRGCQQVALLSRHLSSLHVGEQVQLQLWSPGTTEPRYTLHVIDQARRKGKSRPFALFIAPQGREVDWIFSTEAGRNQLADSAGFERLVLVTLHRGHAYSGIEGVREEVGGRALELAQAGLPRAKQYPVLTLGGGLGSRTVLHEGCSEVSGGYVVEESVGAEETEVVRRLVFLSAPQLSQTETRMLHVKEKEKKAPSVSPSSVLMRRKPCHAHLSFGYHRAMLACLALLPSARLQGDSPSAVANGDGNTTRAYIRVLLVGLGGGALPSYLHRNLAGIDIDVVELDAKMVEVAERWFGFCSGETMRVHVGDGTQFVKAAAAAGQKDCYDAVLLDVDSKDPGAGMSSPPMAFVEADFLAAVSCVLTQQGVFVTNLSARNRQLRATVLERLRASFPHLLSLSVAEDLNEVVAGFSGEKLYLVGQAGTDRVALSPGLRERAEGLARRLHRQTAPASVGATDIESSELGKELTEHFENGRFLLGDES